MIGKHYYDKMRLNLLEHISAPKVKTTDSNSVLVIHKNIGFDLSNTNVLDTSYVNNNLDPTLWSIIS